MKKLLLFTALTIGTSALHAQNAVNRDLIGDVPATPLASPPASPDKPPAESGGPAASEKSPDERFIQKAGKAGMIAVKLAELGVAKASREDLKAFSAMLVRDHSAANAELTAVAKAMGVEIPAAGAGKFATRVNDPSGRQGIGTVPNDPTKEKQADAHEVLMEKSGADFDTAFMEAIEKCHQEDNALFEKSKDMVKTPALQLFIVQKLPVIKGHAEALTALERINPNIPATE